MDAKQEVDVGSTRSSSELAIGVVGKDSRWRAWARALSIETGGIERVTPEERQHNTTHVWNATTFWLVLRCPSREP